MRHHEKKVIFVTTKVGPFKKETNKKLFHILFSVRLHQVRYRLEEHHRKVPCRDKVMYG